MTQLVDSMHLNNALCCLRLLAEGMSRNFRTTGNKSRWREFIQIFMVLGFSLAPAAVLGGDDAGVRGVQQNQSQRQQQQDVLQLRMLQQQRALQSAPAGTGERQSREQLQREQLQRQQQLHYRQVIEPAPAPDDAGTRRAKAEMARQQAQQESERQLQRLDDALQQKN
jgi:hypothetical protein